MRNQTLIIPFLFISFSFSSDPTGVLGISNDGDDQMGAKFKTQKNPKGFQHNPKKFLDQKLTPQNMFVCALFTEQRSQSTTTNVQIALNIQKHPYLNQKILAKFSYPKKSRNRKFRTQKNPSIIPVT